MDRRTAQALAGMLLATLLWGATFVVIRGALHELRAVELVWLRFALASAIFAAALAVRRRRLDRAALVGGALAGLASAGGYTFQAIGLETTAAGTSAFLTALGSLLTGLYAWPLLRQRPSGRLLLGIGIAAVGCALLAGRLEWRSGAGEVWTLLGAACFGLQIVAVASVAERADPLAITAVHAFVIALVLTPAGSGALARLAALSPATLGSVAYLVLGGSVLAPLLQIRAQRVLSAGRIGLLFALEPVFAVAFAIGFGEERYAMRWWLGAALILGAVALVESRPSSAASTRSP